MKTTSDSNQSVPTVLTVPELAAMLRIGLSTAYTIVRNGEIPSVRCGRQIRISLDSVITYLHGQNERQ